MTPRFVRYEHPTERRCWVSVRRQKSGAVRIHVGCHAPGVGPLDVLEAVEDQLPRKDRELLYCPSMRALLGACDAETRAVSGDIRL